ncbi:hypothetical protein ANCCAN_27616 [Ancylostoma caninum]|uniref:Uncharacterized protein n=1 Tax=Ancylostoma caninum TaxID=29170 RepID=A0A368F8Z8_ANCCA|nr:hypothetical protein ANCCAN_27616 [Ancylostoma caninum]
MLVHLFLLFFFAGAVNSMIPAEYFRFRRVDFPDFMRDERSRQMSINQLYPVMYQGLGRRK